LDFEAEPKFLWSFEQTPESWASFPYPLKVQALDRSDPQTDFFETRPAEKSYSQPTPRSAPESSIQGYSAALLFRWWSHETIKKNPHSGSTAFASNAVLPDSGNRGPNSCVLEVSC
jgi:hypothetical protein